jgi:hypothetical protein
LSHSANPQRTPRTQQYEKILNEHKNHKTQNIKEITEMTNNYRKDVPHCMSSGKCKLKQHRKYYTQLN